MYYIFPLDLLESISLNSSRNKNSYRFYFLRLTQTRHIDIQCTYYLTQIYINEKDIYNISDLEN